MNAHQADLKTPRTIATERDDLEKRAMKHFMKFTLPMDLSTNELQAICCIIENSKLEGEE